MKTSVRGMNWGTVNDLHTGVLQTKAWHYVLYVELCNLFDLCSGVYVI